MENKSYLIYEVGILGGNDKGEIKFILFLLLIIKNYNSPFSNLLSKSSNKLIILDANSLLSLNSLLVDEYRAEKVLSSQI